MASVLPAGDSTAITIEDHGLAPMPTPIRITRQDGTTEHVELPVDTWLTGTRRHVLHVRGSPSIVKVQIDPDGLFPDMYPDRGVWTR